MQKSFLHDNSFHSATFKVLFNFFVCLSICLTLRMCVPVCLSVHASVCLFSLSFCLTICLSLCMCVPVRLPVHASVCLSICLSVSLSIYQYFLHSFPLFLFYNFVNLLVLFVFLSTSCMFKFLFFIILPATFFQVCVI